MPDGDETTVQRDAAATRSRRAGRRAELAIFLPAFLAGRQDGAVVSEPRRLTGGKSVGSQYSAANLRREFAASLAEEATFGHIFLFVPVLIGAGAAVWFSLPYDPPFLPLLGVFAVFAAIAFLSRRGGNWNWRLALAIALFLGGMMLAHLEAWRRSTVILDSPVTTMLTGVVERREPDGEGRWRYLVDVKATADPVLRRPPERVSLLVRARHAPIEAGATISGKARLSPPSGPALPGLNDFAFSAYFDGIGAVGFLYGAPKPAAGNNEPAGWQTAIERSLFALRSSIATHIREVVPGDAGAFAAAIVTDERRAISHETTEALRLSGLAHIIAISGLNMALAAGIFFVGLRVVLSFFMGFSQTRPVKKIAASGALVMATAYYLISGFGVSAERAYLMMAVMLIAVFFDRPAISLRNIALSALIIIAISPSEIMGPSFQMSFAATVALVAGYALWTGRTRERDPEPFVFRQDMMVPVIATWNFAAGILVTSLIGSLSTTIFSVDHFHRLATYGLAANLAAMPIISFIVMPAGLVGMLVMPFGLDAPFLKLMGAGLEMVIAVAKHVAGWGGDVGMGRQPAAFLIVATIGFLLLTMLRTRLRLIGLPFLAAAVLFSWQERQLPPPDMLIAEDGMMVALVAEEGTATNRTRPPGFIMAQWRRALLFDEPAKPSMSSGGDNSPARSNASDADNAQDQVHAAKPERRPLTRDEMNAAREEIQSSLGKVASGRFACRSKAWCVAKTGTGAGIVTVEDARFTGVACDVAKVVIAARARFDRCRSGALLINGDTLRKTGALEIRFNGSAEPILWHWQTAMHGTDRPWSRHRFYDWRSAGYDSSLPDPLRTLVSGNGG